MAALPHVPGDNSRLRPDLAYSRLPATAARVFRLLGVHPGPDISAAAVAALADLPASEARDVLRHLVQARLVEIASDGGERWRIRLPAHQDAQRPPNSLADAEDHGRARDRLLEYYLLTAEAADERLRGLPAISGPDEFTDRNGALAWLDAERLCLVAMVGMAADTGREQAAMSLPLLMAQYLGFRGRFDELITVTAIGMCAARRIGNRVAEGEALTNMGLALFGVHQLPEAVRAHLDAEAIFRETGDRQREGAAQNNLGLALHGLDRNDEAIRAHQQAAAIFRDTGNRQGEGKALNNLGLALHGLDRNDEAIRAHREAVAIFNEAGYEHEEANALANLGNALNEIGLPEQASTAYEKAADVFRNIGDHRSELMARESLQLTREMS
jgi:tetratricopeptide (TPR) repeat protein